MKQREHFASAAQVLPMMLLVAGLALFAEPAGAYLANASARLAQVIVERFGTVAQVRLTGWQRSERSIPMPPATEGALVEQVNALARKVPYATDMEAWGVEEYWATPAEFVSIDAGDCEDYVIAKYFTLLSHGVAANKLRMVYVKALFQGRLTNHMVLAYYATPDADPLVLDNIDSAVKPASGRPDLIPVYSFNDLGVYRESGGASQKLGDSSLVRRWSDLLDRVKRERSL